MIEFLADNWIWLAIALLLGFLTAWWAWSQPAADDSDAGMASDFINSATDTVSKTATGAANVTKNAAETTVSTAKSATDATVSAAKTTAKKTKSTAKKAASSTKKTATKAASSIPKTVKKTSSKPAAKKPAAKKVAPKTEAKKAAAKKTAPKTEAKKAAKKVAPKTEAKKAAKKAAPKTEAKKADKKPAAAKKPAAKKATKAVIPNDLELLKGVGPKLNGLLQSLGVTTFDQIANWKAADVRDVDSKLGSFAGRISRDNWVDQAKLLSKGDVKGFEKKYGSLGAEIKR